MPNAILEQPTIGAVNDAPDIAVTVQMGVPGTDGVGVPAGGTTGQVLAKASDTNFDTDWVDQTGGGGGAPVSATYVTLSTNATLTNERVLTQGAGVTITDAGANSTVTVANSDRGSVAVTAHVALADPHTQYVKADGTRAMSGGLTTPAVGVSGSSISFSGVDTEATVDGSLVVNGDVTANTVVGTFTGNGAGLSGLTKSQVGLGNADNTSDANKPVSTATQTALNLKANLVSPTLVTPTLGVATATTINGVMITSGTGTLTLSTFTLTVTGTASVSGTNTGDQDLSGLVPKTTTVNGQALSANVTVTTITGNAGTATALQTARTINGVNFDGTANITVTAAAGTLTGTTLNATVVTSSLTSVGTLTGGATGAGFTVALSTSTITGTLPVAQMPALTGDVTTSAGAVATTIAAGVVTLAKMANMATSSLIYRKTAGSGTPEVNTLATLKTDLGLTGTNSGDQTITLTGDVTGSGTGSFAATLATTQPAVHTWSLAQTFTVAPVFTDAAGTRAAAGFVTLNTLGTTGAVSIDCAAANISHVLSLTGNVTLSLSNEADGRRFTLYVRGQASGFTVTWWSGLKWSGGAAPTIPTTSGRVMPIGFVRLASGEWLGIPGQECY